MMAGDRERGAGSGQRLAELAAEAADAPTARAALRRLDDLRSELDAFERRQVGRALADGASFAAIGRDLGLTRQAVHRRFRDLASGARPLLAAPDVRRILRYAREEATALGADEVRGEHVVVAVLRAGRHPTSALLAEAGVTLERARAQVEAASPRVKMFRREPDPAGLYRLLDAPARRARARGGRRIEVEDLLLGALDDPTGGASRTLRALGVDRGEIRRRLAASLV